MPLMLAWWFQKREGVLRVADFVIAGALLICCPPESRLAERAAATVAGLYLAIVVWNTGLLVLLASGIV